jgi:hypothetical protein
MKTTTMKTMRKIVAGAMLPALLAGHIALAPKTVHAEEPQAAPQAQQAPQPEPQQDKAQAKPLEIKVEESFVASPLQSQRLRATISDDVWLARVDLNSGVQDQWMLCYKLFNGDNTKLTLVQAGDVKENGKGMTQLAGLSLSHPVALPLFGKGSVKTGYLMQFKEDQKTFVKSQAIVYGEHLDGGLQLKVNGVEKLDAQYFVALHNDRLYGSVGKGTGAVVRYLFFTKDMPSLGIAAFGDYDAKTGKFTFTTMNAYKNVDLTQFNQGMAREVNELLGLGVMDVAFPKFTSYLTLGDLTHQVELERSSDGFKLSNQLGAAVGKHMALGGGFTVKSKDGKLIWTPCIDYVLRIPTGIKDLELYAEGGLKEGGLTGYAYAVVPIHR